MASISQCEYNIRRYKTLRSNVNSVIANLSLAIGDTDDLSNEISAKYQINDTSTPIVSRTTQLKNNISSTYNYLNNKVIPAINSAISSLNREIDRLEREASEKK